MATFQYTLSRRRYFAAILRTIAMTLAAAIVFTSAGAANAQAGERTSFKDASPHGSSVTPIPN